MSSKAAYATVAVLLVIAGTMALPQVQRPKARAARFHGVNVIRSVSFTWTNPAPAVTNAH